MPDRHCLNGCVWMPRFLHRRSRGGLLIDRIRNDVLRKLADSDRDVYLHLVDELEPHPMQRGLALSASRLVSDYVYFIDSGVVSMVASTRSGNSVEVALVGR